MIINYNIKPGECGVVFFFNTFHLLTYLWKDYSKNLTFWRCIIICKIVKSEFFFLKNSYLFIMFPLLKKYCFWWLLTVIKCCSSKGMQFWYDHSRIKYNKRQMLLCGKGVRNELYLPFHNSLPFFFRTWAV